MKKTFEWLNESRYTQPLSPACEMCSRGSKMVVLITGLCPASCYYCPLSNEKTGKDRIFADEWELDNEEDIIKLETEARLIDAEGAGITGGDPLVVWQRTEKYISFLKEIFGDSFHIHLYTSGLKNIEHVKELIISGLDEIRFHPVPASWNSFENTKLSESIKQIVTQDLDVALEIPVIPGMKQDIVHLIKWADKEGLKWINLNELEFSETNAEQLKQNNFTVKDDISSAVKGSQKISFEILNYFEGKELEIGIHYCSSSFKDGVQLRNRIKRRAKNVVKNHEIITEDGTILKGVILLGKNKLEDAVNLLKSEYNILPDDITIKDDAIELNMGLLEEIAEDLSKKGYGCFIVETYPTADGLEVERIPLP